MAAAWGRELTNPPREYAVRHATPRWFAATLLRHTYGNTDQILEADKHAVSA